jgi:hypothetical protein
MRPLKKTARIAGLWYLMLALGPFYLLYVPSQTIVRNDAAATSALIISHEKLFRFGLLAETLGAVVFIGLALALYRLFEDVDRHQYARYVGEDFIVVMIGGAASPRNTVSVEKLVSYLVRNCAQDRARKTEKIGRNLNKHLRASRLKLDFGHIPLQPNVLARLGRLVLSAQRIPRFAWLLSVYRRNHRHSRYEHGMGRGGDRRLCGRQPFPAEVFWQCSPP